MADKISRECECGNPKPPKQVGCDRCKSMSMSSADTLKLKKPGNRNFGFPRADRKVRNAD